MGALWHHRALVAINRGFLTERTGWRDCGDGHPPSCPTQRGSRHDVLDVRAHFGREPLQLLAARFVGLDNIKDELPYTGVVEGANLGGYILRCPDSGVHGQAAVNPGHCPGGGEGAVGSSCGVG